jgi:AcrR family transcriptional regulator
MARWEPDAAGRLVKAAIELFVERGYDRTTVQEIAARAGLTERTFFRYFTDKREVDDAVGAPGRLLQGVEIVEGLLEDSGAGRGDLVGRGLRAREAGDLVPSGEEIADDGETDVAGRAGDEDMHGKPPDVRC